MDLQEAHIETARAYVNVNGLFPMQVGINKSGTALGIVVLGGHINPGEGGWDCAVREAMEEASLHILPVQPPAMYRGFVHSDQIVGQLELFTNTWPKVKSDEPDPMLVTVNVDKPLMTPAYLAYSRDTPQPDDDVKGLLLLSPEDVKRVVTSSLTLDEYLASGGQAIFREKLPENLVLEPRRQLRFLYKLLQLHPEIAQPPFPRRLA